MGQEAAVKCNTKNKGPRGSKRKGDGPSRRHQTTEIGLTPFELACGDTELAELLARALLSPE